MAIFKGAGVAIVTPMHIRAMLLTYGKDSQKKTFT